MSLVLGVGVMVTSWLKQFPNEHFVIDGLLFRCTLGQAAAQMEFSVKGRNNDNIL